MSETPEHPIWLLPREDQLAALRARVQSLALRHESHVFEPHVTLQSDLPLSLDGTDGPAARAVRSELKGLRKRLPGVEVVTHDERLSTVTAHDSLRRGGVDSRRGRAVVDQLAAAVILQSWIDAGANTR